MSPPRDDRQNDLFRPPLNEIAVDCRTRLPETSGRSPHSIGQAMQRLDVLTLSLT